jgi:hypothetical protein
MVMNVVSSPIQHLVRVTNRKNIFIFLVSMKKGYKRATFLSIYFMLYPLNFRIRNIFMLFFEISHNLLSLWLFFLL